MKSSAAITNPTDALAFLLAGKATATFVSTKTGARYTFKIKRAEERPGQAPTWFVKLLTGSDNTSDYSYMGMIRCNDQLVPTFRLTNKSRMSDDSVPVRAFRYVFDALTRDQIAANIEIWHEGRCGRCGRALTVPASIASGFGPECITKIAA